MLSDKNSSVPFQGSITKQAADYGLSPSSSELMARMGPHILKIDAKPADKEKKHAYTFLESAVKEMKDRATQRDTAQVGQGVGGERSMASTVRAFNALTKHNLTEAEGWEFMILLKLVRGRQGAFRMDDYTDAAAYAALLGECESTAR